MTPQLPPELREWIACPLCKLPLHWHETECHCEVCGRRFVQTASGAWDFMLDYPAFLAFVTAAWREGQQAYESYSAKLAHRDDEGRYLGQIDEVREVYTEAFRLDGRILDVGGHQGRLRHFLPPTATYISADPFAALFADLREQPALLRAYPCLRQPCNFVRAPAERLPFRAACFDFVHMRSVLDHFADPFLALAEARRVLHPHGRLLIGVAVREDGTSAVPHAPHVAHGPRQAGILATVRTAVRKCLGGAAPPPTDHHMWHPTFDELQELLIRSCFTLEKHHWQKPPHSDCVYMLAARSPTSCSETAPQAELRILRQPAANRRSSDAALTPAR